MNFDTDNQSQQFEGINNSYYKQDSCCMSSNPCPIYECPEERICHRYICSDVPHTFLKMFLIENVVKSHLRDFFHS